MRLPPAHSAILLFNAVHHTSCALILSAQPSQASPPPSTSPDCPANQPTAQPTALSSRAASHSTQSPDCPTNQPTAQPSQATQPTTSSSTSHSPHPKQPSPPSPAPYTGTMSRCPPILQPQRPIMPAAPQSTHTQELVQIAVAAVLLGPQLRLLARLAHFLKNCLGGHLSL